MSDAVDAFVAFLETGERGPVFAPGMACKVGGERVPSGKALEALAEASGHGITMMGRLVQGDEVAITWRHGDRICAARIRIDGEQIIAIAARL